ncbi:MAG: FAD-dependent monooxygenase [Actinomycetota bacterium]|nr:FAD-dependent monooxygenase [Actinomycetota bacterium]
MKAIIIGGGIGGLATAVALQRAGIEAHVYEQAPELKEIGAGLSLWANGVKALHHLGLGEVLRTATTPLEVTGSRKADGTLLNLLDLRRVHEEVGYSSVAMHRGELLKILIDACDPTTLHVGSRAAGVNEKAEGVTVSFSDGRVVSGDILVSADGVLSEVRRQMFSHSDARYAGYSTYRAVVDGFDPGSEWPRRAVIRTLSCGEYFGIGEIGRGRYMWFLTKNGPIDQSETSDHKEAVGRLIRSWDAPVPDIVEATPEDRVLLHPVYKSSPAKRYSLNRAILVGDAAHPIEPALGMGAALALEDAVVLGRCLATAPDPERAFRLYESKRVARVRKLILWAKVLARSEQTSNRTTCRVRDLATRIVPESVGRTLARRAFDFTGL